VRDWRILKPLLIGSTILAFAAAFLSYPLSLRLIQKAKDMRS